MFSEDVVGLVEEMGFQPSSELSSIDGCGAEVDRDQSNYKPSLRTKKYCSSINQ